MMRVLHLPTSVGGNSWALAEAERRMGIDSTVLYSEDNWLGYPCDISLGLENSSKPVRLIRSIKAFLEYRNRFDVFHFNFGTSLVDLARWGMPLLDIPFYPKGSKIIFTYNGCDARQKYKTISRVPFSACHDDECYGGMCRGGRLDGIRERKIEKAARYAHRMFALNPDLMWFLPESKTGFLPYAVSPDISPSGYSVGDKITIVHAPTNRAAKGSALILGALDEIKKTRRNIEVILVENLPHEKALEIYRKAHLVIDQLLIGWYGVFAVEAMKMGRPVAVFIREDDLKFIPGGMARDLKEAVININPSNIRDVLSEAIDNPQTLHDRHRAALEYANRWHDPLYVAGVTKAAYEG